MQHADQLLCNAAYQQAICHCFLLFPQWNSMCCMHNFSCCTCCIFTNPSLATPLLRARWKAGCLGHLEMQAKWELPFQSTLKAPGSAGRWGFKLKALLAVLADTEAEPGLPCSAQPGYPLLCLFSHDSQLFLCLVGGRLPTALVPSTAQRLHSQVVHLGIPQSFRLVDDCWDLWSLKRLWHHWGFHYH